jgi:two-component system, NarL family, response regulator DevR
LPTIRVMLVDDHELVRIGLRAVLESEQDIKVTGEASNAEAAVREAAVLKPDVVVMDIRMPGMDGIEACRLLRSRLPETRVLMLTSHADEEAVLASIMAGATGYLLKNTGRAGLVSAIRSAAAGQSLLDPAVTGKVLKRLKDLSESHQDREVALLSEREKEVLPFIAKGMTNKQIAAELVISELTVRNHISRILEKLGLSSRSEAAAFAAQHGLLEEKGGAGKGRP